MKSLKRFFAVSTIVVGVGLFTVPEATAQLLTNGNFDAAGQGPTTGFNGAIGWQDAFPGNTNSGIFNNNPVQSAPNAAFVAGGNNGGFQLTSQVIRLGDVITLTYYAQNSYFAAGANVNLIAAASQSATFAASSILANSSVAYTGQNGPYAQLTLTYTAVAADVGKNLGVEFDGVQSGGGYTNYDTFVLTDAASAVPEPSTWAAMVGGLGMLAAFRMRRRIN